MAFAKVSFLFFSLILFVFIYFHLFSFRSFRSFSFTFISFRLIFIIFLLFQENQEFNQVIQIWKTNYKNQLDRKIENVSMTWRALAEGIYKGDWVANWGIYSYTDKDSGKKIQVSYHYVARIVNGKISFNRVYYDILAPLMASGYHLTPPHSTP